MDYIEEHTSKKLDHCDIIYCLGLIECNWNDDWNVLGSLIDQIITVKFLTYVRMLAYVCVCVE